MIQHVTSRVLVLVGAAIALCAARDVYAQGPSKPVWQQASLRNGRVQGFVRDDKGRAVGGAMISAFGNVASGTVVSDIGGRYDLPLPVGEYVLRAHCDGYASAHDLVYIAASNALQRTIVLTKQIPDRAVLVAGATSVAAPDTDADHPHDEAAWRLRHLKRTILNDTGNGIVISPADQDFRAWPSFFDWAFGSSAHLATSFFQNTDFTGQVNFLSASAIDPAHGWMSSAPARGVAYVSVSAPVGSRGDWSVRGAMTAGDASSWAMLGEYRARDSEDHAFVVGMSYSTQTYLPADAAALAAVTDSTRSAGGAYGSDRWRLTPRVELDYGLRMDRFDYVKSGVFLSPQAGVRAEILPRTFALVSVARETVAPGAEEFLPPATGPWLPPQRPFAPLGRLDFRAERVEQVEIGLEHQFAGRALSIRHFQEASSDQLANVFGLDLQSGGQPMRDGQYFVAPVGDVKVEGWAARFDGALAPRLTGSIDYSIGHARWSPGGEAAELLAVAPSMRRLASEQLRDLTTSLEANVPETATRVTFVYRLSNGFTPTTPGDLTPAVAGRFDLQVDQALPFHAGGGRWEVLVALRNMFRDARIRGSLYDELLTASPPLRVLGGVQVRF